MAFDFKKGYKGCGSWKRFGRGKWMTEIKRGKSNREENEDEDDAARILIPFKTCGNYIAGVSDFSSAGLIEDAMEYLKKLLSNEN